MSEATPPHTYEELRAKKVVDLRAIAKEMGDHEVLHGYTTMHKEQLVVALCQAFGIEAHEHHEVVGLNKKKVKARIRELKGQKEAAIAARDKIQTRRLRRRIRGLKRRLRKATV